MIAYINNEKEKYFMNTLRAPEINFVVLSGRLTRDPEKSENDKYKLCKFGIAVNRRFKA